MEWKYIIFLGVSVGIFAGAYKLGYNAANAKATEERMEYLSQQTTLVESITNKNNAAVDKANTKINQAIKERIVVREQYVYKDSESQCKSVVANILRKSLK